MRILSPPKLFALVIVLGVIVNFVESVELDPELLKKHDCKKILGRIVKKIIKNYSSCTKVIKAESSKEDLDKKGSCIIKCALARMDLLTPNGLVTPDTLSKFISGMVPEEIHDFSIGLVEPCTKDAKLDPDDQFCLTYGGFAQCVQNSVADFAEKAKCHIGAFG